MASQKEIAVGKKLHKNNLLIPVALTVSLESEDIWLFSTNLDGQ